MNPLILSALLLIIYIVIVTVLNKGLPESISEGYYVFLRKGKDFTFVFMFFMVAIGATFMIYGFTHYGDWPYAWLIFLSSAGLLFVGVAGEFKTSFVDKVHYWAAIICGSTISIWTLIYGNIWIFISLLGLFFIIAKIDRHEKKNRTILWIELFAFANAYIQLLLI